MHKQGHLMYTALYGVLGTTPLRRHTTNASLFITQHSASYGVRSSQTSYILFRSSATNRLPFMRRSLTGMFHHFTFVYK